MLTRLVVWSLIGSLLLNSFPFPQNAFADSAMPTSVEEVDPAFRLIHELSQSSVTPDIKAGEPGTDSDPFFLRSQRQITSEAAKRLLEQNPESPVVVSETQAIQFSNQFKRIYENESYSLFVKNKNHFSSADEGLFVVEKSEIRSQLAYREKTPLFFIPLPFIDDPDQIAVVETEENPGVAVLVDQEASAPIDWSMVQDVIEGAKINLLLAKRDAIFESIRGNSSAKPASPDQAREYASILKSSSGPAAASADWPAVGHRLRVLLGQMGLGEIFPKVGSTFLNGTLYVGESARRISFETRQTKPLLKLALAQTAITWLIGKAQADADEVAKQIEKLKSMGIRVGVYLGAAMVIGTVLRWTVHRNRYKAVDRAETLARQFEDGEISVFDFKRAIEKENLDRTFAETVIKSVNEGNELIAKAEHEHWDRARLDKELKAIGMQISVPVGDLSSDAELTARRKRDSNHVRYVVKREAKRTFDQVAHQLLILSNIPQIAFGYVTEFTTDRIFPKAGAAENKPLRKVVKYLTLFEKSTLRKTPVNANTMAQGMVFGLTDSAGVYIQLIYWVDPVTLWTGHKLESVIPGMEKIARDSVGDASTIALKYTEVGRNVVAYVTKSPIIISSELQQQLQGQIESQVDSEMKTEGLNPRDPSQQKERDKRIEEKMSYRLRSVGLPGPEDFLYDSNTVIRLALAVAGAVMPSEVKIAQMKRAYDAAQRLQELRMQRIDQEEQNQPEKVLAKTDKKIEAATAELAKIKGLQDPESYIGAVRPGLVFPALKYALNKAKKLAQDHPDDVNAQVAYRLLSEAQSRSRLIGFDTLKQIARTITTGNYKELPIISWRETRTLLTALTMPGVARPDDLADFLPQSWRDKSMDGALLAGELYRRSIHGLSSGNMDGLDGVERGTFGIKLKSLLSKKQRIINEKLDTAIEEKNFARTAAEILQARYPNEPYSAAERPTELALIKNDLVNQELHGIIESQKKIKFKDRGPIPSIQRWVIRKRTDNATDSRPRSMIGKFDKKMGVNKKFDPEMDIHFNTWMHTYFDQMLRYFHVHPEDAFAKDDPTSKVIDVEAIRMQAFEAAFTDLGFGKEESTAEYRALQDLRAPRDQAERIAIIAAQKFVATYVKQFDEANPKVVDLTSGAAPGKTQKLRQGFLGKSKFMRRVLRTYDSLTVERNAQFGFWAAAGRSIWGLGDTWVGFRDRTFRQFIGRMTVTAAFLSAVWSVTQSPAIVSLSLILGTPFIITPNIQISRWFRYQGIPQAGNLAKVTALAILVSMLTWEGTVIQMFAQPAYSAEFNKQTQAISREVHQVVDPFLEQCRDIFGIKPKPGPIDPPVVNPPNQGKGPFNDVTIPN